MSRAQAESVIKNIIREIAQECASKGQAVSETLVAFMVCFGCCWIKCYWGLCRAIDLRFGCDLIVTVVICTQVKAVVLDPSNEFNVDRTLTKDDVQKLIKVKFMKNE